MAGIRLTRPRVVLAAVAVAALVAGGIAYASIPDPGGVIHGCRTNAGTLRVIDSASATCRPAETELDWNQVGPRGPQGPAGTAKAWVRVDGAGNVLASFGVGSASVTHPTTGVYCIHGLPFQPHVAVGTGAGGIVSDGVGGVTPFGYDVNVTTATLDLVTSPDTFLAVCDTGAPGTTQVRIYVANPTGLTDRGFALLIDG